MTATRLLLMTVRALAYMFCILAFRVRVYGKRNVPGTGGVILAANHQSYLDPVLLAMAVPRVVSFLARRSLFRNPLFGGLIRALQAFPFNRDGRDMAALRHAVRLLQHGGCMIVFPEGTRSFDGRIGRLKSGALMIAERSGAAIVPAVVEGAFEAWPRHGWPKPARIGVMYGKAISPAEQAGMSRDELTKRLQEELLKLQARLVERMKH